MKPLVLRFSTSKQIRDIIITGCNLLIGDFFGDETKCYREAVATELSKAEWLEDSLK
jgi:hypothetical protein